jgi:hypothetical protein
MRLTALLPALGKAGSAVRAIVIVLLPYLLLAGLNRYFAAEDLDRAIALERQQIAGI